MKKLNLEIKSCVTCPYLRFFNKGNSYYCMKQANAGWDKIRYEIPKLIIANVEIKDDCLLKDT